MFKVCEFGLVLLHLLTALHDRLLQRPGSSLEVMVLGQTAFREEVKRRIGSPPETRPRSNSIFGSPEQSDAASAPLPSPGPLLFSEGAKDSPIHLRWCASWDEATHGSNLPRVVFLPSLMWLHEDCTNQDAERHVGAMLGEIGATLWPPTSWEEQLEHKDRIYAQFNKFMLPARWVKLANVEGSVEKLAATLLDFCKTRGDGKYFVKGSYSAAKLCGTSIDVIGGKCPELASILHGWVTKHHQHAAGIQPFMPSFDKFELRTWLVPDPVTGRWRNSLTVRTQLMPNGLDVMSDLSLPVHGKGLHIARLIDEMLAEHALFFEGLRQLGVPALRIDCGFNEAAQQPFFSEFAACEAWMWTGLHMQDLAAVVGLALGEGVWKQLPLA